MGPTVIRGPNDRTGQACLQDSSITGSPGRVHLVSINRLPLNDATGTVLDVGAGAQPYRPLINRGATYRAIDIAEASERFGYEMPGTVYFSGDDWPVEDRAIDLCPGGLRRSST